MKSNLPSLKSKTTQILTKIKGGVFGSFPYQSANNTTALLAPMSNFQNRILMTTGTASGVPLGWYSQNKATFSLGSVDNTSDLTKKNNTPFTGTPSCPSTGTITFGQRVVNCSSVLGMIEYVAGGMSNGFGRGYAMGGLTNVFSAEIDGIQFSNESSINPSAVLANARNGGGGASSTIKGYAISGGILYTVIDGIQFSDESAISPTVTLTVYRQGASVINSSTRAYAIGGNNSTEIDGIQFSDESAINPSATLSLGRGWITSNTASDISGYAMGGSLTAEVDGILFSNETAINPSAALSVARSTSAGCSSSIKAYVLGGYTTVNVTKIDGIQFSNEAAISPIATLSLARSDINGVISKTRGYVLGGFTTTYVSEIDGIQFSDETLINPSVALTVARRGPMGVQYN